MRQVQEQLRIATKAASLMSLFLAAHLSFNGYAHACNVSHSIGKGITDL